MRTVAGSLGDAASPDLRARLRSLRSSAPTSFAPIRPRVHLRRSVRVHKPDLLSWASGQSTHPPISSSACALRSLWLPTPGQVLKQGHPCSSWRLPGLSRTPPRRPLSHSSLRSCLPKKAILQAARPLPACTPLPLRRGCPARKQDMSASRLDTSRSAGSRLRSDDANHPISLRLRGFSPPWRLSPRVSLGLVASRYRSLGSPRLAR